MAYMSQELKKSLTPKIQEVLKKYGMKGSLSVKHLSSLVCTILSGKLDFAPEGNYVNVYHIDSHWEGEKKEFLTELRDAMMTGNHDNSDAMTDYFDVGWYIDINVGTWNKKYIQTL
jgi:hypothetical protein